ncbi:MAG: 6-bladed beta-propeller [Gracilimonas sp.]|uniref:6-bladed beta-propeller n=1 Tax=Gracilimonas sp. TaxID=1974203 RepID=UPI0037526B7A|nr:6-bladed beta-propeller [Gracilimonas sp.]
MYNFRTLTFLTFIMLVFSACSPDESSASDNPGYVVSLSEVKKENALNDDLQLLGTIGNVIMLTDTKWILMDNSPGVYLFEDYVMAMSFGEPGKGPCEFEEISAIDATDDQVFVMDATQTKIITYDMKSGECVGEINQKDLQGAYYLFKEENKPSFITANTSYMMMTPDSTKLVHRIFENENSEPLDLSFQEIDAAKSMVTLRSNLMDFQQHANKLYFYLPLTDDLHVLNLENDAIHAFPLQIDVKKKELENAGGEVNRILEIIRGDFDFMTKILVHDEWIAIQVNRQSAKEDEDSNPFLQFYTHDGNFIAEIPIDHKVLGVQENSLIFLKESSDPNSKFTHFVEYRDVIME